MSDSAAIRWPDKFPFGPEELARYDEAPDTEFYSAPRFVTHIDDAAIGALTAYYARVFPASGRTDTALLDICSSWISHYPAGYTAGRISGLGMNEAELKRNSILSDYVVADLNATPQLPYPDATFDVVTNAVSVDYLTKPLEVMKEVQRVLKPGGLALMSFSNRCFPTKAIAIWTSTGDLDHIWIVGTLHACAALAQGARQRAVHLEQLTCRGPKTDLRVAAPGAYMHFAGGFEPPEAVDISPNKGRTDPMYVVIGKKALTA